VTLLVRHNTVVPLPERIGRLRRISRLGVGGFATVWLYHDEHLDSPVAVKALADNWAQLATIRDRFVAEARILRRADSDHVVRVYDVGDIEDGTPYFVMTYADLGTVADLLARGTPGVTETVRLIGQAGRGIAVLHRLGVVHRDIKPQNLLLQSVAGQPPRLLVADLGVAKAMLKASGITQVVGTPAYMAPEQATPGAGIDERADVHALAAVTYHLLTGRVAREGGIDGLVRATTPPPPPSTFAAVSPALDEAVLAGLVPDRERRWASVEAFVAALEAASDGTETTWVMAATTGSSGPAEREGARDPWSRRLVALVLAVLVAAFVLAYVATTLIR
jgi:serine/threonine protein kinase